MVDAVVNMLFMTAVLQNVIGMENPHAVARGKKNVATRPVTVPVIPVLTTG